MGGFAMLCNRGWIGKTQERVPVLAGIAEDIEMTFLLV